jgi:hypothetical protein
MLSAQPLGPLNPADYIFTRGEGLSPPLPRALQYTHMVLFTYCSHLTPLPNATETVLMSCLHMLHVHVVLCSSHVYVQPIWCSFRFHVLQTTCLSHSHVLQIWSSPPSPPKKPIIGIYKSLKGTWMCKLGLRPRNSFSGNVCFEFLVLCLCSAMQIKFSRAFVRTSIIHSRALRTYHSHVLKLSFSCYTPTFFAWYQY